MCKKNNMSTSSRNSRQIQSTQNLPAHLVQWSSNRLVNPHTGANIKEYGPTYMKLQSELEEWIGPEGSPVDKEKALGILMEKLALEKQSALVTSLTGVSKSLRQKGKEILPKQPSPSKIIPDAVLNEMISDAISKASEWRVYKNHRFVLTPEATKIVRERCIKLLGDIWKFVKWPKTMPRGDLEEYAVHKLAKFIDDGYFVRTPYRSQSRSTRRGDGDDIFSKMHAQQFSHSVFRSMEKIQGPKPELVNGILMRYAIPEDVARPLALYLQASTNQYILEAIRNASMRVGLQEAYETIEFVPITITVGKEHLL